MHDTHLEDHFDPARFASGHPIQLDQIPAQRRPPRHEPGEEFLRGPVPLVWLRRAAQLRGKALAVGIALWFKAGITKRRDVKASSALWHKLGINRKSAYRALSSLESDGLIAVERHPGRVPVVTILESPPPSTEGDRL